MAGRNDRSGLNPIVILAAVCLALAGLSVVFVSQMTVQRKAAIENEHKRMASELDQGRREQLKRLEENRKELQKHATENPEYAEEVRRELEALREEEAKIDEQTERNIKQLESERKTTEVRFKQQRVAMLAAILVLITILGLVMTFLIAGPGGKRGGAWTYNYEGHEIVVSRRWSTFSLTVDGELQDEYIGMANMPILLTGQIRDGIGAGELVKARLGTAFRFHVRVFVDDRALEETARGRCRA